MKRHFADFLRAGILLILWGAAFLAQHLACFDVFDGNLWYLYPLAAVFALVQWAVLFCIGKFTHAPGVFQICIPAYLLGVVAYSLGLIAWVFSSSTSWGLMLLCVVLDVAGYKLADWCMADCECKSAQV